MLSRIRERKLVQWVIAYTAGAFVLVSGLDVIAQAFPAWTVVLQTALVLTFAGLPIVLIIGWFHGEKGRQRVSPLEVVLIGVIVTVSGILAYHFDVYGRAAVGPAADDGLPAVTLDSTRIAVLPFRRDPGLAPSLEEENRVHDALAHWRGLELVDVLRAQEAADRERGRARRTAAALGAGRYVEGSVAAVGSRTRVAVGLFDTRRGTRLAEATAFVPRGVALTDTATARMAAELLFPPAWGMTPTGDAPMATASYPARRAFLAAMEALDRWSLSEADSLLGVAASQDMRYSRAFLWRAQVRAWDDQSPAALMGLVETALAVGGGLNGRELRLARALRHMAREEYVEACAVYDSLRALDERDFAAWFGLGECRARDNIVVRDPRTLSGWAFRTSYRQAVLAYERAFLLFPSVFRGVSSRTFEQVGTRLRVSSRDFWPGRAMPPDTTNFLARAALVDDTLAFIPFPAGRYFAGEVSPILPTYRAAVERQRRLYNGIAERWADAFPGDREALTALAHTREMIADPRALETLDAAMAITNNPGERLMMAVERVNLLLKFGSLDRFREVRSLADSILDVAIPAETSDLQRLAITAALAGRAHESAHMAARGAEGQDVFITVPVAVMRPTEALTTYAALGKPADSIAFYERLVDAAIENRIPPHEVNAARSRLMTRAASLAYLTHPLDCFRELANASGYRYNVLQAEAAHADGLNSDVTRILSDALNVRLQKQISAAQVSYDALFAEAWLWAQVGDTAQAVGMLDATLNTRRWSEPGSLNHPAVAASFVRAMALRAELAAATNDTNAARQWAGAVLALWGNADDALAPVTDRMLAILDAISENTSDGNPPNLPPSSLPTGGNQ